MEIGSRFDLLDPAPATLLAMFERVADYSTLSLFHLNLWFLDACWVVSDHCKMTECGCETKLGDHPSFDRHTTVQSSHTFGMSDG